ncbi:MAG: cobalamin biosynthesis protein CobD [Lachnospiraceae bacterium]|nr:cobalamin biosynthesis protein CobD [Lachnospiraceae bacterium]
MELSAVAVAGFLTDCLIGDPESWWHPVRGMGWMIERLEKILRTVFPRNPAGELMAGGVMAVIVMLATGGTALGILELSGWIHPGFRTAWMCVISWQVLAARSLKTESKKVYHALTEENVEKARQAVSRIVGRDTKPLAEEGIIKAAVETVAENTSDGVIAPLFYLLLFGPVGALIYKAVNTMDSMVGYKNQRYRYFGRIPARLDDLMNLVPARLTAFFLIVTAWLLPGFDGRGAFRIWLRDRYCHKSPNSAHSEAACAGALGVELAGPAWYFGVLTQKPVIGDEKRKVEREDIIRVSRLMMGSAWMALAAGAVLRCLIG